MLFSFFVYRRNGAVCNYVVKNCMLYAANDTKVFLNWKFPREAELNYVVLYIAEIFMLHI